MVIGQDRRIEMVIGDKLLIQEAVAYQVVRKGSFSFLYIFDKYVVFVLLDDEPLESNT